MFVRGRRAVFAADEAADEEQKNCGQQLFCDDAWKWNELPLTGVQMMVVVVMVVDAFWKFSWSTATATVDSR